MWSQAGDSRLIRPTSCGSKTTTPHHPPTIWQLTLLVSALLEKRRIEKAARLIGRRQARHVKIDSIKDLALLLYSIGENASGPMTSSGSTPWSRSGRIWRTRRAGSDQLPLDDVIPAWVQSRTLGHDKGDSRECSNGAEQPGPGGTGPGPAG